MPETRTCSTCQTPLPADAPEGACPRCLLIAGLESATGTAAPGGSGGAVDAPSPADLAAYFPALEILELIGQGGMGIVYKARQKGLNRLVALKILAPEMASDAAFADRFTREAQALARLSHANIVGVHEFGETEGLYYFAMEYVDGMNLREALHGGHLKAEEALAIVPQICDALQYAHDSGVVHRDIKPENVLIGKDGQVKIADFGLAKLLSRTPEEYRLTRAGQVMGTPHYMAPEQIESPEDVDHRADIYSLGVVFYEMLTGELPLGRFQAPSRRVQMDVRLDDVVLRALEKAPDRRYQQVSEVKTRVNGLSTSAPSPARSPVPPPVAAVNGARSRLSKLALWGFLCFPASIVGGVLTGFGMYAVAGGGGSARVSIASLVAASVPGMLAAAGTVVSIIGWIVVSRSEGRLHGKGFAIAGTFLPVFLCMPLAIGMLLLGASRQAVANAPVAVASEGGVPVHHKALAVHLEAAASGAFGLEGALDRTAWQDAERIRGMNHADRELLSERGQLGPLFWLLAHEEEWLEIRSVETKPDGTGSAEVVSRDGQRFRFRLVREQDGVWYIAGQPLER